MRHHNLLSIIFLSLFIANCDGSKKNLENVFAFDNSTIKPQYTSNEKVSIGITNSENKKIDSVIYYVNDKKLGAKNNLEKITLDLKDQRLGYQNLKALIYFEGQNTETHSRIELVSDVQPKLLKYTIVNTFPHDTESFTEGLEFYRDTLIESTGQNGKSYFRKYDYKTGKVYKQVDLEQKYFGEGITVINNKIYQLTYKEKTGFIYNANTLKLEKKFSYDKDIEGWGMTNDGKYIYHTDGTEKIWKMDPETQKRIDYINVYSGSTKIKSINELEWINGKIYTNVWLKDAVAVLNPENGKVEGILDLSGLRKLIKNNSMDNSLNGIAYNPKTKTIFVTGKNWDKLFEIKVTP